jgi:hypothetical protein
VEDSEAPRASVFIASCNLARTEGTVERTRRQVRRTMGPQAVAPFGEGPFGEWASRRSTRRLAAASEKAWSAPGPARSWRVEGGEGDWERSSGLLSTLPICRRRRVMRLVVGGRGVSGLVARGAGEGRGGSGVEGREDEGGGRAGLGRSKEESLEHCVSTRRGSAWGRRHS